jgi:peptide/nickel transport system permease protein
VIQIVRAVARRIPWIVITVWVVSTIVFFAARIGGDPVSLLSPPAATAAQRALTSAAFGLNKPIIVQYGLFLKNAIHGDFGQSYFWQQPAFSLVLDHVGATWLLAVVSTVVSVVIAVPLGLVAAYRPNSLVDRAGRALSTVAQSIPVFWLAPLLAMIFAVHLRLLPASGNDGASSLVLPAVSLAAFQVGLLIRTVRSSTLDVLSQDAARLVRAKGVGDLRLAVAHTIPNIAAPTLTIVGLDLGRLLGGAVIVETFFAWPGIGQLLIQAAQNRDYPVLQSIVVVCAACVVIVNMVVDALNEAIDPRSRPAA